MRKSIVEKDSSTCPVCVDKTKTASAVLAEAVHKTEKKKDQ